MTTTDRAVLRIDWIACTGHGQCAELLTLDEWGFPVQHGTDITGDLHPHVRRAIRACPRLALRADPR